MSACKRAHVRVLTPFLLAAPLAAFAEHAADSPADTPTRSLGVVTVTGGRPTSLPTHIPTTMEGVTQSEIERSINATDSEDALKYLPSLLVRKRYIGDYNHAILSSRASGTGNSARSAVYADGILLSNYLGNGVGGLGFPPRWGLVTADEIERVDVMYGPFSAAYPGNSVGAVVDYVTRMPTRFEVHAKAGATSQPFDLYGTHETFRSWQTSTSVGNKAGDLAWLLNFQQTDSHGQPLGFATRLVSTGTVGTGAAPAGTPVAGAVLQASPSGAPWYLLGTTTEYRTRQNHYKLKLAYDLSSQVRAAYTLGVWQNSAQGRPATYLRDAAGQPFSAGTFSIDGRSFAALTGADFASTDEKLTHAMHGLSIKRHTRGIFDWEIAASLYDYRSDLKRQNAAAKPWPASELGGVGTLADGSGTGWRTLALKGTWRPDGMQGAHIVDFGYQQEHYRLRYLTSTITGDWTRDGAGTMASRVGGNAHLQSLYVQDAWALAPRWKLVAGGRAESWRTSDGLTQIPGAVPAVSASWPARSESHFSPKGALSWQWLPDTVIKGSVGRAVRFPTVGELYGATSTANSQYINDPNLRPERSWTGELSVEKDLGNGTMRLTLFSEDTRDALYSQATFDPLANRNVTRVQNVGRIGTHGLEAVYNAADVWLRRLDVQASGTWTDSTTRQNAGFVTVPGDTIGKRQPNIPRWRATAVAAYRWSDALSTTIAARYSGRQFRTLDNADINGSAWQGVSRFFTVDVRARFKLGDKLSAALGIDNLNNDKYWNFHPYPQRTYSAELRYDL